MNNSTSSKNKAKLRAPAGRQFDKLHQQIVIVGCFMLVFGFFVKIVLL